LVKDPTERFIKERTPKRAKKWQSKVNVESPAFLVLDMSLFTDQFMIESLKTEIEVMKQLND
jgi:hypothetical protein